MGNLYVNTAKQVSFDPSGTILESEDVQGAIGALAKVYPSNPSLLDNGYFIGGGSQQGGGQFPINQMGETEYTNVNYGIDRWRMSSGVISLKIEDGYISITNTSSDKDGWFECILQGNSLFQHNLTGSFLFNDNTLVCGTGCLPANAENLSSVTLYEDSSFSIVLQNYNQNLAFATVLKPGKMVHLKAAKLELGPVQTLAHKEGSEWILNDPPPNYALELAKCQRYQLVLNTMGKPFAVAGVGTAISTNKVRIIVPLPATMRNTPTLSISGTWVLASTSGDKTVTETAFNYASDNCVSIDATIANDAFTANDCVYMRSGSNGTGRMILNANL